MYFDHPCHLIHVMSHRLDPCHLIIDWNCDHHQLPTGATVTTPTYQLELQSPLLPTDWSYSHHSYLPTGATVTTPTYRLELRPLLLLGLELRERELELVLELLLLLLAGSRGGERLRLCWGEGKGE